MALHNVGVADYEARSYEKALAAHRRALAIREKTLGRDHPDHAFTLSAIGADLRALGQPAASLGHQERYAHDRARVADYLARGAAAP